MKLLRCIMAICCACVLFVGCSADNSNDDNSYIKHSKDDELYESGLELISVMNEMIQSDEYAKIFFSSTNSVESILETVNTNDYDSPTAVYRINLPRNTESLLNLSGDSKEMWNDLSNDLKKQLKNRFSFSSIPTMINGAKGSSFVAFTSAYTAADIKEKINLDKNTTFLYVFEKGTPIAVTFTKYGGIQGQFVFLDNADSLSAIKNTFKNYQCTVDNVDFN